VKSNPWFPNNINCSSVNAFGDVTIYIVFTENFECNCHCRAPSCNCMTHCHATEGFPDMSQISLHKSNEINLIFIAVPADGRQVRDMEGSGHDH
jgi:hypothetical protein